MVRLVRLNNKLNLGFMQKKHFLPYYNVTNEKVSGFSNKRNNNLQLLMNVHEV